MATVRFPWSPVYKKQKLHHVRDLTEIEYLTHPDVFSYAMAKTTLTHLKPSNLSKYSFDPAMTASETIDQYSERIMPNHPEVYLEAPLGYLVEGVNAELKDTRAELASMQKRIAWMELREYQFGAVNTLVKLTKHITSKKEANAANGSKVKLGDTVGAGAGMEMACRIAQAAQSFTLEDMTTNMLDHRHLKILTQKFPRWIAIRNEVAHDNPSRFAQLLLGDEYRQKPGLFEMWQKVFEVLFHKTIEECAAEEETAEAMTSID